MNALVTGATGFVGQVLCGQLLEHGALVRAVARRRDVDIAATETVVVAPLEEDVDWRGALRGIDTVFHLAALAHVVHPTRTDPELYERVNAAATEGLARAAAHAGVGRFVLLSSLKVNGEESPPTGFTEAHTPRPEGVYAVSKFHAERRLADVAAETEMGFTILRPPLVYGPRVRANFLALLRAVDRGLPLPLGRVRNRRSFISVGNLCSALRCAATHPAAARETFLVSDGEPMSMPDLVTRIAAALGKAPRLLPVPGACLQAAAALVGKRDALRKLTATLVVDDQKIRSTLGWRPPEDFDGALRATAAWYRAEVSVR